MNPFLNQCQPKQGKIVCLLNFDLSRIMSDIGYILGILQWPHMVNIDINVPLA